MAAEPSLLSELTEAQKLHLLALEFVGTYLSEVYTTSEEVMPAAEEILDFLKTGKYEREEAEVKEFPKPVE